MDLLREKLRSRGLHRAQVAAALVGSAVVGGAISASGSKSAANTQANAANNATQSQRDMFNQTVGLEAPFRQAGESSTSRLSQLLGLPGYESVGTGRLTGAKLLNLDNGTPVANQDLYANNAAYRSAWDQALADHQAHYGTGYGQGSDSNKIEQYLRGALAPEYQKEAAAPAAANPEFGSLMKPFSMDDFQMDPGTQFRLKYGQQALQNSQAAHNGVLSGGALKDLIGFNQDYAGLGYQSAFDRYMANKSFTLGSLMDVGQMGQAAAGNNVNAAPSFSSGISNTITGAGNASAAGTIGASNALSGAATGAGNAYFLRNLMSPGGAGSTQAAFSQTGIGSSGFGTGVAYGNQDMGQYL